MNRNSAMRHPARPLLAAAIALLVILGLAGGVATAGPHEEAEVAAKRGDYATAYRLWLPLASDGDAEAQFALGFMYRMGHGVSQDHATSANWYLRAAAQGHARSQANLGTMYSRGEGVEQDYHQAANWYRLAADQGLASAQLNLALMYESGRGVPYDPAHAVRLYELAAEQGNVTAQNNLGASYAHGRGVPEDAVQAYKWLSLAALRYPSSEQVSRNLAAQGRDDVAKKMTPEQIAEAEKLAREWKPKR